MSDYYTNTGILRDSMAQMLADNEEHFFYVLSLAITSVDLDEAIELGELASDDPDEVVNRLRQAADAIEGGTVS